MPPFPSHPRGARALADRDGDLPRFQRSAPGVRPLWGFGEVSLGIWTAVCRASV